MPVTLPYSSQGTILQVSISAVFTAVNQSRGFTGPTVNWTIEDITTLSSTGGFKEKFPVIKDPGTVAFDLVYNPADAAHEYLRASNAANTGVLEAFKLIIPSPAPITLSFSGYVTKFEFDNQSIKVGLAKVDLTLSGAITKS